MHRLLAVVLLAAVVGCATVPRDFSPTAGRAAARRDIAAGEMRIYMAGTVAVSEPGVESRDEALVARLPRDRTLPRGCRRPRASDAADFAEAYNREIIRHLRHAKSS